MAEIYRVEKGSEEWKYKAYDYVRTDAFCLGQNIPIELEFGQDESKDDLQAILLTEDHKPVAGCRIAFPAEKTGKIERVCVVREKQKSGYGRVLAGSRRAHDGVLMDLQHLCQNISRRSRVAKAPSGHSV